MGGQVAGHEGGRGLALEVGVGGDYHLFHALGLDPVAEFGHPEPVHPHSVDGAEGALQHVIAAPEFLGPLHRHDVGRLLHHADQGPVPAGIGADGALVAPLGQVEAAGAHRHLLLGLDDGPGQAVGFVGRDLQKVQGHPLGRLGPYPRQPAQLVDQSLDGDRVAHRLSSPRRHAPAAVTGGRPRRL